MPQDLGASVRAVTQSFVVAGAGIAGLTVAAALQQRGHDVTVLEERTDTTAGAGISLWPNALAALDAIGLGNAVRAAGAPVTAGSVRWSDGRWLRRPDTDRLTTALGEPMIVLPRASLLKVLTDALRPGTVELGVAVREVVSRPTSSAPQPPIRITAADGRTFTATALIGADGTRSVVARHLNGPLTDRYAGYTAWRAIARRGIDPTLAGETLGPGVQVGHVPLGPDHTYWFATERLPEGHRNDDELAYLRRRFASWPEPIPALLDTIDPTHLLRTDLYDREDAAIWSRGPIVLTGDAAHPMRPHLGQGGCQAIEDAVILAAMVKDGSAVASAFAQFAQQRRRHVQPIVRESQRIGQVVNLRPTWLGATAARASTLVPEALLMRHLATIASRKAFLTQER